VRNYIRRKDKKRKEGKVEGGNDKNDREIKKRG
jgi:hypothetical protein